MPGPVSEQYTLELAEEHIGDLRGQVTVMNEAITQDDTDVVPNTPTAGSVQFSAGGNQKYVAADGNAYNTGRLTIPVTGGSGTFTTTFTLIPGLTSPLGVGTYRIHGFIYVSNPGTAGQGNVHFRFHATGGLTASSGRFDFTDVAGANLVAAAGTGSPPLDVDCQVGAPGSGGSDRHVYFDGTIVVSVAGTINLQVKQDATVASSTPATGCYMEILPIS